MKFYKKITDWLMDNYFFKIVVIVNCTALSMALYWVYKKGGIDDIEPFVASASSFGVLLVLFYVNNRITKPLVKLKMNYSLK